MKYLFFFFFSSRRRHTRLQGDWSSDVCSSDLASTTVSQSVGAASTTTAITTHTPNPSVVGQGIAVAFTVTSGGGTPTGNVTVSDGTENCSGSVAAGTCTPTPTSSGSKTLTATYGGDLNFAGSTSPRASHTVNAAGTTTTITAHTPDPSARRPALGLPFPVGPHS